MTYGAMYDYDIELDEAYDDYVDYYGAGWSDCFCKEHNTFHENCDELCECNGDD